MGKKNCYYNLILNSNMSGFKHVYQNSHVYRQHYQVHVYISLKLREKIQHTSYM